MSTIHPDPNLDQRLSHSQSLIWTGQQLHPDAPLYNMAIAVTIPIAIDVDAFRLAFDTILASSDALRTVFIDDHGSPKRIVRQEFPYQLPILDFSAEDAPRDACRGFTDQRAQESFDLSERLFEAALIRLGPEESVWFFNQHHLITDAWSTGLLFRRLVAAYRSIRAGNAPNPRPQPTYQGLVDFLASEEGQRSREKARAFWQSAIADAPAPPSLYGATRRHSSTASIRLTRPLGMERSRTLRALAQDPELRALTPQLTLFNLFSCLLLAWMYRSSGQGKLALGCLAHNRTLPVFKETTGTFIELFPLLAEIDPGDSLLSLNTKVRDSAFALLQHSQPGASLPEFGRCYNVVLNYITATFGPFGETPIATEWVHCGHGDAGHHLRLQVEDFDENGEIVLSFDFNRAVFDAVQREFAITHFLSLLDALITNPGQQLCAVALVGPEEETLTYTTYNQSQFTPPDSPSVISLFDQQATRTPTAIALSEGESKLSYCETHEQACALAATLRARGIGPGHLVGILLPRSSRAVIAILGILKAGAAYLPLDPTLPRDRTQFILSDSNAVALIAESAAEDYGLPALVIAEAVSSRSEKFTPAPLAESDPAYLIYTSGSTGKPKGVLIEHHSLLNYASWASTHYCNGEPCNFPLFTPLTFDLTVTSIFVPLISGGEIVVYPDTETRSGVALLDVLEDDRADVIKLTPSHLSLLQNRDFSASRVRALILGGENLTRDLANSTLRIFGDRDRVTIYNEYGPTEATVGCMTHAYDPDCDKGASVPIGTPAANAVLSLLDEHFHRVPRGATGEIFIAGPGVARGYHNRPELDSERFIPDPCDPTRTLYRTGDLARMNESNQLEYTGRIDDQVKVRGVRIEPGEIEAALWEHHNVESAAVVLVDHGPKNAEAGHHCPECGLPSNFPGASYDKRGVCHLCRGFESYQIKAKSYFRSMDDLRAIFARSEGRADYDCMMLLSGGKDSTYALARLVDLGLKVQAFTLDNGYLSDQAKGNIKRVVEALEVDHEMATTPAMNAIFADSLRRFSNVCNGCFKTVYTLAMKRARELQIPFIVTGLSRGQFFETRLTEELFNNADSDPDAIDRIILDARKAYHRADDAVNRLLDASCFSEDEIFEEVRFIDFYRYCPDSLDEMLSYLDERVPWIRPSDTGRSTNCLINDAGIYVHKQERGFHNYAFPYSWDVRMGHKERNAALAELDDEIDEPAVMRMLKEVGYEPASATPGHGQLAAYYVASQPVTAAELRAHLASRLPAAMVPAHFVQLEHMPLTTNGKLNRSALPAPGQELREKEGKFAGPRSTTEEILAEIWAQVLRLEQVGIHDNFLELGGDSILAIQIVSRANEAGLRCTPGQLLTLQTVAELALVAESNDLVDAEQGVVSGALPLTPALRWFFGLRLDHPARWCHRLIVAAPPGVTPDHLEAALNDLVAHHDALRLSARHEKEWTVEILPKAPAPRLRVFSADQFEAGLQSLENEIHLESGALLQAGYQAGPHPLLALVVHHLATDAVSWPILLADLASALNARSMNKSPRLPRKTTSFLEWATGHPRSNTIQDPDALHYWTKRAEPPANIPRDATAPNGEVNPLRFSIARPEARTAAQARRIQFSEIILTALATTLRAWTGSGKIAIELEGHGRDELVPDTDVSRTVGWFTTRFPLVFDLPDSSGPSSLIAIVQRAIADVPLRGASFQFIRDHHPSAQVRDALGRLSRPDVLFNYLGDFDQLIADDCPFKPDRPLELLKGPNRVFSSPLEVNILPRADQFDIHWDHDPSLISAESSQIYFDRFQAELRALFVHLGNAKPNVQVADFPQANLNESKLDKLSKALKNLK